ncbi:MAG: class I tRNA ligase family protein [Nitrososphaerales archaeon]
MVIKSSPTDSQPKGPSLPSNYDWKVAESRVRQFRKEVDFSGIVQDRLKGIEPVGYVEGPPTLNGVPHIGHIRGRIMKDLWYRFSTLSKKNVVFRAGWDCQGLPVELQAEKELGLSGNKWEDLKQIGEEKMVEACKRLITKYLAAWEEADDLLGLLLDHSKAYMTYRDSYIEREWRFLESAWNDGILGEGFKVVPYCPSCQTSLSHAEAVLGYETLEDPSLFYKVKTSEGTFLIIWTTMPFTVITDEMVGVKPDADYAYVKMGDEVWVVGAERMDGLARELKLEFGETIKVVKGRDLEGLHYVHPLLDLIPGQERLSREGKIHVVVAEDFVDTATGTGVVHLAPANGEEDFFVATRRKLPVFVPIDDRVCFTEDAGRFAGMFVRDTDALVAELLRARGNLISDGRLEHEYPTCWRSGHRLVWVARREYFYWIDRIKDDLVVAAEKVEYYFEQPRNRFLEFIRQSPPWCISRERVWGTPLPIWVCSACKEKVPAFSRESILEQAVSLPDGREFELHRPWIDRILLKCPKCGGDARREPFVLDTWHNSGSAPLASFTDEERRELVPVDHLTEGIDQTRGWAYTLLVLNVIYLKKPVAPYRAFLFQGHVLDEKGRKMSKSLGNVVDALAMLRNDSVDLLRFYITWKSSPVDAVSLDLKEMTGRPYQILNTLYHLHVYLKQNGEQDGFDPAKHDIAWAQGKNVLTLMDRWLLASLNEASAEIKAAYSEGRYNDACKKLESQIVEVLSQGYVRMVRNELWSDSPESLDRRLAIYAVIAFALKTLDLLLHPVSPYVTEYLYQEAFLGGAWSAPLLVQDFPAISLPATAQEDKEVVDLALEVEGACNSARQKAKLKRRWPLREIQVLVAEPKLPQMEKAKDLVSLLCNVKKVSVARSVSSLPILVTLTANRSQIGAHFKEKTQAVLKGFRGLEGDEAWRVYQGGKPLPVQTEAGVVDVPVSTLIFSFQGTGEWEAVARDGIMIALEKVRDDKLIAEGLLRDIARRLQALRKARGYSPTAVLDRAMVAGLDEEMTALLEPLASELNFLVRVRDVRILAEKSEGAEWEEDELDGRPIYIDVS